MVNGISVCQYQKHTNTISIIITILLNNNIQVIINHRPRDSYASHTCAPPRLSGILFKQRGPLHNVNVIIIIVYDASRLCVHNEPPPPPRDHRASARGILPGSNEGVEGGAGAVTLAANHPGRSPRLKD